MEKIIITGVLWVALGVGVALFMIGARRGPRRKK
jgi:hypothetical protein